MKIVFIAASLRFTGGRLVMFRHANELARRGHDVSIRTEEAKASVEWMELRVPLVAMSRRELSALEADICFFDRVRLAAPLLRSGIGKVVHFCQGYEGTDSERRMQCVWRARWLFGLPEIFRLWNRRRKIERAYRLPTIKIVIHDRLGELLASRFGHDSFCVPNGYPAAIFTPSEFRAVANTILVVGPSDSVCKCIPDALEAVKILKRRRPQVRLIRVAQHPMRAAERSLGVTDEYHTMLLPSEMADLYRKADILLLTSDATEGFGLPLLEAMACGLPCVATDIPAFRTFATPSNYARFVSVGDREGMATALEQMLGDDLERRQLRERGLKIATGYTMERSFNAMESALTAIMKGKLVA